MDTQRRIIRKPDLMAKIQLSDATIWRLEHSGRFPKRLKLGGQAVGWFLDEVDAWLQEKADKRGQSWQQNTQL